MCSVRTREQFHSVQPAHLPQVFNRASVLKFQPRISHGQVRNKAEDSPGYFQIFTVSSHFRARKIPHLLMRYFSWWSWRVPPPRPSVYLGGIYPTGVVRLKFLGDHHKNKQIDDLPKFQVLVRRRNSPTQASRRYRMSFCYLASRQTLLPKLGSCCESRLLWSKQVCYLGYELFASFCCVCN